MPKIRRSAYSRYEASGFIAFREVVNVNQKVFNWAFRALTQGFEVQAEPWMPRKTNKTRLVIMDRSASSTIIAQAHGQNGLNADHGETKRVVQYLKDGLPDAVREPKLVWCDGFKARKAPSASSTDSLVYLRIPRSQNEVIGLHALRGLLGEALDFSLPKHDFDLRIPLARVFEAEQAKIDEIDRYKFEHAVAANLGEIEFRTSKWY